MANNTNPFAPYCLAEGKILPRKSFHNSINPLHKSGKLPYCKDCIEDLEKFYMHKYDNLEYTIYLLCAMCDIPFLTAAYNIFEDQVMKTHRSDYYFPLYLYYLNFDVKKTMPKDTKVGFDLSDKQVNRFDVRRSDGILDAKSQWGEHITDRELDFLETRWKVYTEGKYLTPAQSQLYRNLCLAEKDIWKGDEVDKAQKRQIETMKLLGLDKFNIDTNKTLEEQIIENDIFLMEQNEPAEYYKDKDMYKDFRGIHSSWTKEILRPVLNFITGSREYGIDKNDANNWSKNLNNDESEILNG